MWQSGTATAAQLVPHPGVEEGGLPAAGGADQTADRLPDHPVEHFAGLARPAVEECPPTFVLFIGERPESWVGAAGRGGQAGTSRLLDEEL